MKKIVRYRPEKKTRPYRLKTSPFPVKELQTTDRQRIGQLTQDLAEVEHKLKHRNEIMEALATQNVESACETLLVKLLQLIDLEAGAILLYRREQLSHLVTQGVEDIELIEKDLDQYSVLRRAFVMRKSVQLPLADQMYESAIPVQSPSNGGVVGVIYLKHPFEQFNLEQVGDILDLSRKLGMTLERHLLFHQMEHEKIKTYQLLDSIREAVLYIESSGEQIYANQALLNMFPPKLVSQSQGFRHAYERATSLFEHVDQPDALHDYIGQLMNGEIPGETIELSAFRGNLLLSAYAERIAIANVEWGMMLVLRDVTKEKELDLKQSEFVSIVSHELRTPLSSIMGFTELLMRRSLDGPRQKKYLETIHSETVRLAELIDDILEIQKGEDVSQGIVKKQLDLKKLVHEMRPMFELASSQHRIRVSFDAGDYHMTASEEKMKQLFTNLIMNAIKYSPDGGTIQVQGRIKGSQVVLTIEDEGIGIPEKALPYVFDKFYRADNSDTRKIGGTGLGLAICRMIVMDHGGSIAVQSEEGRGSTFTLQFPVELTGD
ncbi:sensor histidine kinase [Exiguobacterium sp. K1]|uniref:sensor histidine kinase n=1 Tax=Exiguobacterium sp. K1 TaxID=2980105 RepID=UPI00299D45C7|nr:ATP-binding protein [Exiguobacterium sp. K1]MDX1260821.1 ATP-binding protein [Exiguobacterium sp. K1]